MGHEDFRLFWVKAKPEINWGLGGTANCQKGGRKVSKVQVENVGLKAKEYLGSEVLVGEEGTSFYGSRFGNSFCCSVEVWFYGPEFCDLWIPW